MKAIAFYLPQYHATPENDQWWHKGFTEWDNVRSAKKYYSAHYQPHVPHNSIGYYDLSDLRTIERQHKMALDYGISSFCYYYYNFAGKTILEKPLKLINKSKQITNNFCLCWANADWTRTWYGQDKTVLVSQEYNKNNAKIIFEGMLEYFENSRYLMIDEKPLVLVFNPESNPIMEVYSEIWREQAVVMGFRGLYIASVEALQVGAHPSVFGFDAAVEFAPDWTCSIFKYKDKDQPRIFDYQATIQKMMLKIKPDYNRIRCIFPSWDNTPRYHNNGIVFDDNSLGAFKYFAEFAATYTQSNCPENLQYVFINAWNEWGEGCHLEPDKRNGYLPLEIVSNIFTK